MKQVIKTPVPENAVLIDKCSPKKYYGLVYKSVHHMNRAILTQIGYDSGQYFWLCVYGLNNGNYAFTNKMSFNEALDCNGKIFEFDTPQELLKWAAE